MKTTECVCCVLKVSRELAESAKVQKSSRRGQTCSWATAGSWNIHTLKWWTHGQTYDPETFSVHCQSWIESRSQNLTRRASYRLEPPWKFASCKKIETKVTGCKEMYFNRDVAFTPFYIALYNCDYPELSITPASDECWDWAMANRWSKLSLNQRFCLSKGISDREIP